MLKQVFNYLKNPKYIPFETDNSQFRINSFFKLLVLAVAFSFSLGLLNGLITEGLGLDLGEHAIEALFENNSILLVFLLGVVLAPLIEELLFRAPLALFKNVANFKLPFYLSVLLFGAVHITNFEFTPNVLLLSPLLVAPQLVAGVFLGFTRVKLGLGWAILLHALHNLVLIGPFLLFEYLNIPLE